MHRNTFALLPPHLRSSGRDFARAETVSTVLCDGCGLLQCAHHRVSFISLIGQQDSCRRGSRSAQKNDASLPRHFGRRRHRTHRIDAVAATATPTPPAWSDFGPRPTIEGASSAHDYTERPFASSREPNGTRWAALSFDKPRPRRQHSSGRSPRGRCYATPSAAHRWGTDQDHEPQRKHGRFLHRGYARRSPLTSTCTTLGFNDPQKRFPASPGHLADANRGRS